MSRLGYDVTYKGTALATLDVGNLDAGIQAGIQKCVKQQVREKVYDFIWWDGGDADNGLDTLWDVGDLVEVTTVGSAGW